MLGAQEGQSPLEEQLLPQSTPVPRERKGPAWRREGLPWTERIQSRPPRAPTGLAGGATAGKQRMVAVGSGASRVPPFACPPAAAFAGQAAGSRPRPRAHWEPILLGPWTAPSPRAPLLGSGQRQLGLWEPGLG